MPQRHFTKCAEPGCTTRTRSSYCELHLANNQAQRRRAQLDRDRKSDKVWRLYQCAAWKRFRISFMSQNPMCQRIQVDGKPCRWPAFIVHHLISPRVRPDLMYSASNCVSVCQGCHPITEGELPEHLDKLDTIYIPTVWRVPHF